MWGMGGPCKEYAEAQGGKTWSCPRPKLEVMTGRQGRRGANRS